MRLPVTIQKHSRALRKLSPCIHSSSHRHIDTPGERAKATDEELQETAKGIPWQRIGNVEQPMPLRSQQHHQKGARIPSHRTS